MRTTFIAILTTFLIGATWGWPVRDNYTVLDCVDDVQDFSSWSANPQWNFVYSGDKLPGVLRGKLDGPGIWYKEYASSLGIFTDLGLWFDYPTYHSNFLYVKYYMHFHTENETKQGRAFPAMNPDEGPYYRIMPKTQDWVWAELVVELNSSQFGDYYHGVHGYSFGEGGISARNFDQDEYFVVEKMIVAQGFNFSSPNPSANDIKKLCGWGEVEPPITARPPTTPDGSGDFCTEPGIFPDPVHCDRFHVCQLDAEGEIWDSEFTCPATTVWCQRTLECESPDICPCAISLKT